jgi:hypothetical protein
MNPAARRASSPRGLETARGDRSEQRLIGRPRAAVDGDGDG